MSIQHHKEREKKTESTKYSLPTSTELQNFKRITPSISSLLIHSTQLLKQATNEGASGFWEQSHCVAQVLKCILLISIQAKGMSRKLFMSSNLISSPPKIHQQAILHEKNLVVESTPQEGWIAFLVIAMDSLMTEKCKQRVHHCGGRQGITNKDGNHHQAPPLIFLILTFYLQFGNNNNKSPF